MFMGAILNRPNMSIISCVAAAAAHAVTDAPAQVVYDRIRRLWRHPNHSRTLRIALNSTYCRKMFEKSRLCARLFIVCPTTAEKTATVTREGNFVFLRCLRLKWWWRTCLSHCSPVCCISARTFSSEAFQWPSAFKSWVRTTTATATAAASSVLSVLYSSPL